MQTQAAPFTLRLLTVAEYHKIAEAGIFHPEERVELIGGQIIKMIAKGTAHTSAVRRTAKILSRLLATQADIITQDPVQLSNFSEPEPDIAVVKVNPLDYADHHPTTAEVYLIIEVADISFKYDCDIKGKIYAQSGIRDYWLLDVNERQLHVFREPTQQGYQSKVIFAEDGTVSPLQFPNISIAITQMLQPLINQ
ncbi:Uma2 family endonuclease [Cylindrospermum sp. FACHB-282]|uniref:Uma2 family endonuclease n=1 Tax=Cylindrospermum sp. FACHB-282 TaxID=2692794 RepID=UPI001683D662|nr:Uma2 family endonuclease [Cylindrospermum sp. FACHB-282]MBD2383947.1 Uma2 family endonuclease [Cylindrospermum sp. FACHB-282]